MASRDNDGPKSVVLTPAEDSLRRLLLDVAAYFNPEHPSELRFTGGWVRDKLLNITSHDIDVGISDMTGYQFGLKMKEFLAIPGKEPQYGDKGIAINLHKIAANPEKSKHLETVTTKIYGLDVDLVNLRKETYSADSRNPQMEFGTPREDAMRRDATINAMFYNLRTQAIEDFTGQGRGDLEAKIIRTPLEPYQTFNDDPLRILRLIRFASRFDYAIDPAAAQAMGNEAIRKALRLKISRERVGVEIEKTLNGPDPRMGLSIIDQVGLYNTVFTDPEHDHDYQPENKDWHIAYDAAASIMALSQTSFKVLFANASDQAYITWILSTVVPWADAPLQEPKPGAKSAPPPAFDVIRNGLKAPMKICDIVRDSVLHADDIISTKDMCLKHLRFSVANPSSGSLARRDGLGMRIRQWGQSYKSQIIYAMILEAVRVAASGKDVLKEYATFVQYIVDMDLLDAPNLKPVIDGKTLAKELHARPGPWMKSALDEVMAWQLLHPEDARPEAAIEALRSKHGELPSRLVVHILTLTIRPLFSQTKTHSQAEMTLQGRRVMDSQGSAGQARRLDDIETAEDEAQRRPWKQAKNTDCFELLEWCLQAMQSYPKRTEQNWPLVAPPILALIDDIDIEFKARGCRLLRQLLQATPSTLLAKTGLGQVFQDAVTPCLSYLPTLTSEEDSITILSAAYPTILTLAEVRHPPERNANANDNLQRRERLLVHILHHHLLRTFAHVEPQDYPDLITSLLNHLGSFLSALGLDTVAHLNPLISAINAILACELGHLADKMLIEASQCLQRVVVEAWPRIWRWRGEVLNGVCFAWVNIEKSAGVDQGASREQNLETAKQEMRKVVRMLSAAVNTSCLPQEMAALDFAGEVDNLVAAEPCLATLLIPNS